MMKMPTDSKRMRPIIKDPAPPDAQSRRVELAELVGDLGSKAAKPSRARSKRSKTYVEFRVIRKKQRYILGAALLILIPGIASLAFTYATNTEEPAQQPEIELVLPELTPQDQDQIHAVSRKLESKAPNDRTAQNAPPLPPPNFKAERDEVLRTLAAGREAPEFIHPSQLEITAGKALTGYCLLNTPLDPLIEEAWEEAGMFRNENEILSPLLRHVYLENNEAVKRLMIAVVDGVTLDPKTEDAAAAK
jgi:hypothetical protein